MGERDVQVVWCTAEAEQGLALATALVDERLIACANLIPGVTSVYRWEGQVETASEVVLMMKTTADRLAALKERIGVLHAYDVPEILVTSIADGSADYLDWVRAETTPQE